MITVDKFDLNIEKILENWELHHALREVLANAIDEQILTNTKEVAVFKNGKAWYIRDYGRGIRYVHLTQNENDEKLKSPDVIGKFGIGLKDALATFERHGIKVTIKSKFCIISTQMLPKDRFADILTLHAMINPFIDKAFIGTEVVITGVSDEHMEKAKKLFLKFSDDEVLETTRFGQIVAKSKKVASIYINGVKVAEEPNFLFSYNITHRNAAIRKSLNRERNNVGRTAYADIVKKIILSSKSKHVAKFLADDIQRVTAGVHSDELGWLDVQEHAVKLLNATGNYLFVSADQIQTYPAMIEEANMTGCRLIVIPQELKYRISGNTDMSGNPIRDIEHFMTEYNDSFVFDFVDLTHLSVKENLVFKGICYLHSYCSQRA
jgi:hypothetical protein